MEFDELDKIYREVILEHCRNPRNQHAVENYDFTADGVNPFCGDEIHLQVGLAEDGRVEKVGFRGEGCSINQATGSILTKVIEGKTLEQVESVSNNFHRLMLGDPLTKREVEELGELEALSGVRRVPVRIKCALLALSALDEGICNYRREH